MSLINLLKDFIFEMENDKDYNEKRYIHRLDFILDQYYEINIDTDTPTLMDLRGIFDTENKLIPLPSYNDLLDLDTNMLHEWIKLDKLEYIEYQMVLNACKQNYDDDYIMLLIELGFQSSIYDTLYLAQNKRIDLICYYYENKLPFNEYTANEFIKQGRIDILNWLFCNKLIKPSYHNDIINTAIMFNKVFILGYLLEYHNIKPSKEIYYTLENEFNIGFINDNTLMWLWIHDIKWTREIAIKYNNNYMLSYYT